jgi:hypothetical protein
MSEENYNVLVPSTRPELKNIADCAVSNLIPEKSKRQYDKCYNVSQDWCNKKNVKTVSDNVILAYLFIGIYLLWKVNVKFCYDKLYHLIPFRLF